ncbi:stress protein [[Leptolyngbya] sp. PCC 7376]|uniref:TerD family protein n=1 Tax=[Leptolyngbya] sp. PCC 7376 TaxID=111781 RepID=UPI00029F0375|nr:TerD family protein [[Leptolyngbya] sp. PCC 7376]AFY36809.1 stress protein [[Leptolyngbya] sp. PCC 7376]
MAIQLKKGNSISLKKEAPQLNKIMLGLGWDMAQEPARRSIFNIFKASTTIDLDSAVFCLNSNDALGSRNDVVYYANLHHNSGAIHHQGDNLTGEGEGDDEQIMVELSKIPDNISSLLFTVNIYMGKDRRQDFSNIKNAFVRLVDFNTNREIAYYKLSESAFTNQTLMKMAELRRTDNGWQMKAIGEGSKNSLDELVKMYRN